MVNTKFGKRLFGLFLAFICVFALIGCTNGAQIKEAALKDAQEKVDEIYSKIYWSKDSMSQVTADVKGFITETLYENVTVSWESSEEDILSTTGKVTLPSWEDERNVVVKEATEDEPAVKVVPVKVTATITGVAEWEVKGKTYTQEVTAVKEFNFTVKALAEGVKLENISALKAAAAQYIYEENGVSKDYSSSNNSIVYSTGTRGVVVAIVPGAGYVIHDGTDGVYVYDKGATEVKLGDQVTVFGDVYSYYGSLQFGANVNATVEDEVTIEVGEYNEYTPQELESKYAEQEEDGSYVYAGYFGGELISVTGQLVKQSSSTGEEYALMDVTTQEIVWIYRGCYENGDALAAMVGKFVTVRGAMYGRDSRLQKNRIAWDGTEVKESAAPELTDAEKLALLLAGLVVPTEAEEDFSLSADATWEIVSGTGIEIVEGVAKVTKGEAASKVVLRATATVGAETDSKEFEVTVPAAKLNTLTVAEAIALGASKEHNTYTEEKYAVTGEITEVYDTKYGNMKIKDAEGNILTVYGTYSADGETRYDALEVKPVAGDIVTVYGIIGQYNGTPQVKNGWIVNHYVGKTVADAIALGASKEHNTYTEEKYAVTGEITEVYDTKYGNMKIKDAEGNILTVYGTYSADGETRYDALEVKPVAGDIVTVYGIIGQYNGTPQVKNGWIVAHTAGGVTPDPEPDPEPAPEGSIKAALEAAEGTEVTFSGTVSRIYYEWDEDYGNMSAYVKDDTGEILVFRFSTKVVVGDKVNVAGKVTVYNSTNQIAQGATVEIVDGGSETPDPEPTGEVTIAEALKAADGTEVTIKATVHVVDGAWNTEFKNMNVTLKDETGTLYVYRLATQVKLGDIVTLTGKMATYNDARQIGAGATAVVTGHDTSYDPVAGSASISFASTANRTSLSTTQQVWEQNGIKVTGDKASSTTNVADYSNPARFYKGSNLTIEFTSAISKIVITCSGGAKYYVLEEQAVSAGTLSVDGAVCTITFDTPVTSVVLTNLGQQTRITTIEVTPAQ